MANRFAAVASLVLAYATALPALAAENYKVAATISHGGAAVGAPVLQVAPDSVARVRLDGEAGYQLMVVLEPADEAATVRLNVEVETARGEIASRLTTPLGHPVSVASGDIGLELTVTQDDARLADASP